MPRRNMEFLNDLLQSIGGGLRKRRATGRSPSASPTERFEAACEALMGPGGEPSRIAVAELALNAFREMGADGKAASFRTLLARYGAPAEEIRAAYAKWDADASDAALVRLFSAVEPARQTLLRRLNMAPGGTLALVRMREDLFTAMRDDPSLAPLDADFAHLFASWFNRGFLVMRRIDWNTPAAILDKIVAYEAVHEIRDWDDLRRRLDPADRRCYGFFHPATGDEPLIFVEVALCEGVPAAIGPLLTQKDRDDPKETDTAVFYSISNCQPGLKGVSFGNFLIKQVVRDLSLDLPQLDTFVTLSPAPKFAQWLDREAEGDPRARNLRDALQTDDWRHDAVAADRLSCDVKAFAARYFLEAKTSKGAPVDPVARFHLGNGASAHRINWPADMAQGAVQRSYGLMINYLYDLDVIEEQHETFARDGAVARSPDVENALKGVSAAA